jgi:hypothetical protein
VSLSIILADKSQLRRSPIFKKYFSSIKASWDGNKACTPATNSNYAIRIITSRSFSSVENRSRTSLPEGHKWQWRALHCALFQCCLLSVRPPNWLSSESIGRRLYSKSAFRVTSNEDSNLIPLFLRKIGTVKIVLLKHWDPLPECKPHCAYLYSTWLLQPWSL